MDKINRTPGREFDGKDLLWLLDEYRRELPSRVAPATAKDYIYLLAHFERWWKEVGEAQKWLIHRTSFNDYLSWLKKQPSRQEATLGIGTLDAALKRLRQFFKWAWTEEFYARDYSKWIPKVDGEPPLREAPDPECLERLFAATNQADKPVRNKAILAVLIGTAVRRTECTLVDVEHIHFNEDLTGKIVIPLGKNYKPRIVVFDDVAGYYISALLAYLAEMDITSGPIFRGRKGRLTPKGLYDVIRNAAIRAGFSREIHGPHDLRRMFATYWSRKQRGEGYTQPLSLQMGHTDKKMTLHYSRQDLSDVQAVFVSPMEKLRRPRPSKSEGDAKP